MFIIIRRKVDKYDHLLRFHYSAKIRNIMRVSLSEVIFRILTFTGMHKKSNSQSFHSSCCFRMNCSQMSELFLTQGHYLIEYLPNPSVPSPMYLMLPSAGSTVAACLEDSNTTCAFAGNAANFQLPSADGSIVCSASI